MDSIRYINRVTGKEEVEKIYGAKALNLIYGKDFISQIFGPIFLHSLVKYSFFSALYGKWQALPITKKKVKPFIEAFLVDENEFLDDVSEYKSFNDFFVRKLKKASRPVVQDKNTLIMPADARYMFYSDISKVDGFLVKGQKFDLHSLLNDNALAEKYKEGSMVMARLCPTDYHRFHFPCDCIPGPTKLINGFLYSVNPVALKKDIHIFTKNKRTITELQNTNFGTILFLEIGATNVGSIIETYTPNQFYEKASEKGYFSFGGSSLILLFEKDVVAFDFDLINATKSGLEIKCLMGQSMATKRVL